MLATCHFCPLLQWRRPGEAGAGSADDLIVAVAEDAGAVECICCAVRIAVERASIKQHRRIVAAGLDADQTVVGYRRADDIDHIVMRAGAAGRIEAVAGIVADGAVGDVDGNRPIAAVGVDTTTAVLRDSYMVERGVHAGFHVDAPADHDRLNEHAGGII